jgi:succinate-acetate transporter protein
MAALRNSHRAAEKSTRCPYDRSPARTVPPGTTGRTLIATTVPAHATAIDVIDLDSPPQPEPASGAGFAFPQIPAGIALQLGALSIVLALLSCAEAKLFNPAALGIVIPVAFSVGAVAIFAGGLINFRAGILIAGVIGCLYGAFWLSVGLLLTFNAGGLVKAVGPGAFGDAFGTYLLIWGIMSTGLALPVYFVSKVVFTQQALLGVVFFVLAAGAYAKDGVSINQFGGYLGLIDAAFCFYISLSLVTNETAGKTVLPLP